MKDNTNGDKSSNGFNIDFFCLATVLSTEECGTGTESQIEAIMAVDD